ncbi:MAG: DoxX family protein [Terrimicrobiaceae bacterium]|nr:DoxX family protein [Terrimicrobiaceae bacterium]
MLNFSWLNPHREIGLLLLRASVGVIMMLHGWPKLAGGEAIWVKVGAAMQYLGIGFWPAFWGFLAAVAETLGGFLLVIGFLTRPAALALTGTMVVATMTAWHTSGGEYRIWAHPAVVGLVCLSIFIVGAGRYSVDRN